MTCRQLLQTLPNALFGPTYQLAQSSCFVAACCMSAEFKNFAHQIMQSSARGELHRRHAPGCRQALSGQGSVVFGCGVLLCYQVCGRDTVVRIISHRRRRVRKHSEVWVTPGMAPFCCNWLPLRICSNHGKRLQERPVSAVSKHSSQS